MSKTSSFEGKLRAESGVDPANPVVGNTYYDTTNNRMMRFDGAKWSGIGFALSTSTSSTTTSTSTSTTSTSSSTTSTSTSVTTSTSISTSTSTTTTL